MRFNFDLTKNPMLMSDAADERGTVDESFHMSLEEVAQELEMSAQRIRQIQQAALSKLRRQLKARGYGTD